MNIVIWVLEILVGAFFAFHATLLWRPNPARLQSGMNYILEMSGPLRSFAGAAEGLAGIALIVAPFVGRSIGWCRWPRRVSWPSWSGPLCSMSGVTSIPMSD